MHHTQEKTGTECPHSTSTESSPTSKDSSSKSNSSFPCSAHSTASTHILRLRLSFTYNQAALSCLQAKPQVRTLNSMSIPLPLSSDKESPTSSDSNEQESLTAEAKANSPHSLELSPTSSPDARLPHRQRKESPTYQILDSPHILGEESPVPKMLDSPATMEESPTPHMPDFLGRGVTIDDKDPSDQLTHKSQDQGTKKIETQMKLKVLPLKTFAHQ